MEINDMYKILIEKYVIYKYKLIIPLTINIKYKNNKNINNVGQDWNIFE